MLIFGLALCGAAHAEPLDVDPWDLVRVDVPDYPGADATSRFGSVLLSPPDDVPWRPEPMGELDAWDPWEGKEALGVAAWHAEGLLGAGIKVAVFDSQWYGAELRADVLGDFETHDCYAHPSCEVPIDTLRPRFGFETGSHGVACAEVVRSIAPGVELHLVRVAGLTSLENAVDWAVANDIDLISMSLSYFAQSFYDGTGPVNDRMGALIDAGTLMVTSAGNYAQEHWQGTFRDDDGDGALEFSDGEERLDVYFDQGSGRLQVTWDEFGDCGRTDLSVRVYDGSGGVIGWADDPQDPDDEGCWPTEWVRVEAPEAGWYTLGITRVGGEGTPRITLFNRGGYVSGSMREGTVTDPGTHPDVLAVGAVRAWPGYLDNGTESFSSEGPTAAGVSKPDIAGPDGLSTSVYGQMGFYGTSASTPAVTAALALLMSEDPTLTPVGAADRLRAAALPVRPAWAAPDQALGDGRARLPPPGTATSAPTGCARAAVLSPLLLCWGLVRARRREDRCDPRL